MAQVFKPGHVLLLKAASLAALVVVVAGILGWRTMTEPAAALDAPVEQPIPFSHKHHVKDDGIDCRYCHASVETSARASLPTSNVCWTCHSQLYRGQPIFEPLRVSIETGTPIQWLRVHDLPDFVYFNHSIHVAKGVGCETCHGRIDEMPLTRRVVSLEMQWCLECHRNPERFVRPHDQVYTMGWNPSHAEQLAAGRRLVAANDIHPEHITQCSICHR